MDTLRDFLRPEIIWFLVGLVLLVMEFALPGLIIGFFGIGAWIVAAVCLITEIGLNAQLAIFIVSSVLSLLLLLPASAAAQKDWYNLDHDRPFRVEDARAIDRRALEFSVGPLGWTGGGSDEVTGSVEASAGILPRTQLSLGVSGGC